jgi:DNA/RNA-binding domain of Phe-tRNA-synthetase-like protein
MVCEVRKLIDDARLVLGVVEVKEGAVGPASETLRSIAAELVSQMSREDYEMPEEKRRAVRQLLRIGGFSPSGRNRPAQELIIRDLKERGEFNYINNVVDVNNVVSLESLLPISVFDVAKLGTRLTVRIGEPGEGYIFNQSGQWLDVKRCIVCCHGDEAGEPVGSPVKDSMATKIFDDATHFCGVIYGTTEAWTVQELQATTERFANLLAEETGGSIEQAVCH